MMRVLFLLQSLGQGGSERSISYLAHGLAQRGHHVAVAALHAIAEGWEEILDPRVFPVTIFFQETPGSSISAAHQLISATGRLRRLLQAEMIGCISCTAGPVSPVAGWLASRLTDVEVVWHLQAVPSRPPVRSDWRTHLLKQFGRSVSPTVPLLISCSGAAQAGAEAAGYRCKRHVVIYNGVDAQRFRPDAEARAAIRSEWGISSGMRLVGLVGRLDPTKGHPVFLEAAKIMAAERDDLFFVCVGDGPEPYRGQLHRLGTELGLGERLIWTGTRSFGEMPAVYNALDVLCLSSYEEAFGNVLAEAMACGIPCVSTRVGGAPEVIGDFGSTVPPGDPAALAQGVLTTLLAEPRPSALRRHVVRDFGVKAMIDAVEREFKALLYGGEPKSGDGDSC